MPGIERQARRLQGEEILHDVHEVVLSHVHEVVGHERGQALGTGLDLFLVDLRVLGVSVAQSDGVGRFLDKQTGHQRAAPSLDRPGDVLIGDRLAGKQDRLEEILTAGFLADDGQVRAHVAAHAANRVAFQALQIAGDARSQQLLAVGGIALARGQECGRRQLLGIEPAWCGKRGHGAVLDSAIGAVAEQARQVGLERVGQASAAVQVEQRQAAALTFGQSHGGLLAKGYVLAVCNHEILKRPKRRLSGIAAAPGLCLATKGLDNVGAQVCGRCSQKVLKRLDGFGAWQTPERLNCRRASLRRLPLVRSHSGNAAGRVSFLRHGDQFQPRLYRLWSCKQGIDSLLQFGTLPQGLPLSGKVTLQVIERPDTQVQGQVRAQRLQEQFAAAEVFVAGNDLHHLATPAYRRGRIEHLLLQPRHDLWRPQLPDEVGDLFVPFGKLFIEVSQNDLAAFRITADGDADGFQVEAVLAVIPLCQFEDQPGNSIRTLVAQGEKRLPQNSGGLILHKKF